MKYSLKELRARNNLSQEELAKLVNLTARTIINYENDIESFKNISYKNLEKLAIVLNVKMEDIFLG